MTRLLWMALVLVLVTGCQAAGDPMAAQAIPTLAQLPSAEPDLAAAEPIARGFLEAWRRGDPAAMYELVTFSSQEATPVDRFTAIYDAARQTMTLESLDFRGNTLQRENGVALFNYDVTFTTRVLGEFADTNRNLRLVFDDRANDWRVAWTEGDIFAEMAAGGQLRLRPIIPPRANIYDRNGLVLASQNGRVVMVSVIRDRIPDFDGCMSALAQALGGTIFEYQAALEERPSDWVMEMGTLDSSTWEAMHVQLENTCAARFEGMSVRRYDNGPIAAHLIGYVGYPDEAAMPTVRAAGFESDSILGRSGLELAWDETLRGQPGGELTIVTPSGQVLREVITTRSQPPRSLWLTLDANLQARIFQILADAYAANAEGWAVHSKGASVVVMHVPTGQILAMVSYPSFDNNAFTTFPEMGRADADAMIEAIQTDERRPQLNRPMQGAYPLGSVMKLVSSIAAADSGVYALDERFTCTGIWNRDITRYDWLAGGHGTLTLPGAITQSCNPFFYEVGYRLDGVDPTILPRYAREMGFGTRTGLENLPESDGLIVDPEWWRQNIGREWNFSESVNMAIGQGYLEVTPLQVTRMVAAIAARGRMLQPQLVYETGLVGEAQEVVAEPVLVREIAVRPEVLDVVRRGMCDVTTTPQGTAEFVFRDSELQTLGVCGKTGTAQTGGSGVTHAWFVAYAPRDNPEIVAVVMVENGGEGSGTAAPISRDVLEAYFFGGSRLPTQ